MRFARAGGEFLLCDAGVERMIGPYRRVRRAKGKEPRRALFFFFYCLIQDGPPSHVPLIPSAATIPAVLVTERGILIVCPIRLVQSSNAQDISVTLAGITGTVASAVQCWNVLLISTTLLALLISGATVSEVHPANALLIFVTLDGITGAVVSAAHLINVKLIFVTLFALLMSGAVTREVHSWNVASIFTTLPGIAGAAVSALQFENVPSMLTTLFGITGAVARAAQL